MESETMNEPISDLEEPQPKRFLSRWGGIYFSPKETFQEIGQAPRVLVPITALLVVGLLVFITLYSILDTESMAANQFDQMVAKGQMTPEQVERMAPVASVMINVQIFFVFVLGNVFYGLLIAGFVKLFSAIVGARNRFKAVFSITLFSLLAANVVHHTLLLMVVYLKGSSDMDLMSLVYAVSSNLNGLLSSFLEPEVLPKYLMSLFRYVDIFAIWIISLISIGSAAVSKKLKTSTAAMWLGGAYAMMALIGSAFGA
ncbi:MAG: hypothetical protein GXX84_20520 [Acidobacteria bacterium]|nr:hypothetical protein [Acidobacteriota bacterium]